MWRLGNNRWGYIVNSPLNFLENLHYRFCRNGQCNSADAIDTMGSGSPGFPVQSSESPQSIKGTVSQWAWLDPANTPAQIATPEIAIREGRFYSWCRIPTLLSSILVFSKPIYDG